MYSIIGFRIKYYFNNLNNHSTKYIFCIRNSQNKSFEIHGSNDILEIHEVSFFQGFTWIPKKRILIPEITNLLEVSNDVFSFDLINGIKVNTDLFRKSLRHKEKRPVWLLLGENKYIYQLTKNMIMSIYNTNLSETLSSEIISDIIIIGEQKYFSIDEILLNCKGDNEYIFVNFTMYKNNDSNENIFLFTGPSNMGKSYLSHYTEFSVYETDSSSFLPSIIDDRIVSIGKKYNFDINELISKFVYVNNYIIVDFTY
jgi:hypothetical protein